MKIIRILIILTAFLIMLSSTVTLLAPEDPKTAVYISHRLSSCKFCDDIVVFDHGHIVQQGSHQQLVEAEGVYAQLWQAQAQYYQKQEQ